MPGVDSATIRIRWTILAFFACGAVVAATMLYGAWVRRRLGGVTGDVLGAAVELVEVLVLLAAAGAALHPACTSLIFGE